VGLIPHPFFDNMELITAPAGTAITLTEAKEHLRILDDSFDTIIQLEIEAAQIAMMRLISVLPFVGTVAFYERDFDNIILDVSKIATIVVKYFDENNAEQTLDASRYNFFINAYPCSLNVTDAPSLFERPDAVTVECTTSTATNEMIKQGLKMIVGDLFETRQTDASGMTISQFSINTQFQLSLISKRIEV